MPTVIGATLEDFNRSELEKRGQIAPKNDVDDRAKLLAGKEIQWTASKKKNAQLAADALNEHGFNASTENPSGNKTPKRFAAIGSPTNGILVNPSSDYWSDPVAMAKANYESGHLSTDHPMGVLLHEIGHTVFEPYGHWLTDSQKHIAGQVGRYAASNPKEFVSEVYAGTNTGKTYSPEVMNLFKATAKPKGGWK